MSGFRYKFRILVSGMLARPAPARRAPQDSSADWLPPMLGPGDWSIGMMADRGTGWYFDRGRR
jgi:hypothetical protein